ncbi:hypothetical protein JYP52_21385 [Nitratireductor aquibiodomus]|uniref:hypothetical protein n=1 Tax=Nitratireductor aquibiodomus TaxID=204799 RepID=UPI0019D3AA8A|nr:hypothetical protein [Nitratireductor aquibiodomus]MBN7763695.1 hypothetical protein [Nitratireductor aquibiodomus]
MGRSPGKTTFIGPVATDTMVRAGKRSTRYHFLLMQAGGEPLRLDYDTKEEAHTARQLLSKNQGTYTVPTLKLFRGIQAVLAEVAHGCGPHGN